MIRIGAIEQEQKDRKFNYPILKHFKWKFKCHFRCFSWHFKIGPVYDLSYLTSAFFFWIARTVIWFCWRNVSSWIKMKIAAYCLLLFLSWWAIRFEKECPHWKFNICSKYRLHNVQSFQDSSDSCFLSLNQINQRFARFCPKLTVGSIRIFHAGN